MRYQKPDQVQLKSNYFIVNHDMAVDMINSFILVALGFGPTLIAMEVAWKLGKMSVKRGEKRLVWRST